MPFSGFAFFAMVGIVLVGAAARFKIGKSTEIPHVIGATGGIALALISIGAAFNGWAWAWLPGFFILAGILKLSKISNYTWWVEVLAFVMIIIALFVHT